MTMYNGVKWLGVKPKGNKPIPKTGRQNKGNKGGKMGTPASCGKGGKRRG